MFILFLRAILMYVLVFTVLRLTGKRQVSDLQPFDLLITLLIADLAGCSIADTDTPLVYSVVPILALYLTQQLVTWICLKSAPIRRVVCGAPVLLIADGAVMEEAMRRSSYTVLDLLDQLRSRNVFDLDSVAYAILETNGTMSVLLKGGFQTPSLRDCGLPAPKTGLPYMLILDGRLCRRALRRLGISESWVQEQLAAFGIPRVRDVFFLHLSPDGRLRVQTHARCGSVIRDMQTERTTDV